MDWTASARRSGFWVRRSNEMSGSLVAMNKDNAFCGSRGSVRFPLSAHFCFCCNSPWEYRMRIQGPGMVYGFGVYHGRQRRSAAPSTAITGMMINETFFVFLLICCLLYTSD